MRPIVNPLLNSSAEIAELANDPWHLTRTKHLEVRKHAVDAMQQVAQKGEGHKVAEAFQSAGGLTKEHRAMILDPLGIAMHDEKGIASELTARGHIQHLGDAIVSRTPTALNDKTFENLSLSLQDHAPLLRDDEMMHLQPEKWQKLQEARAARAKPSSTPPRPGP